MKKILKSRIFFFVLGLIVMSSVGVVASGIFASSITYDNTVSGLKDSNNQDVTTVQGAIDVLYAKTTNSPGYAALFSGSKGISSVETYVPVVYLNNNYVETITDGIKIKNAGNYKIIATSSHSANSNTTELKIYVNGTQIGIAGHSILAYSIVNETVTLNENDEIKVGIWSDGNQGTVSGGTLILIKL